MDSHESLLARIERLEEYCTQQRGLEGDIEHALARRDDKAIECVDIADRELLSTRRECVGFKARLVKARRGDFPSTERSQEAAKGSGASKVAAQERQPPLTGPPSAVVQTTRPGSYENVSLTTIPLILTPTVESESLSGSLISCPEQSTGTDYKSFDVPEDDISDDFLTVLVQRYADLCHERQTLHEEIEDKLEREERMGVEKLARARTALDTTRQNAVEIVAALIEASGGDAQVRVPRSNLHNAEARSGIAREDEFRYPSGLTAPSSPFLTNTNPFGSDYSLLGKSSVEMSSSPFIPPMTSRSPPKHSIALHLDLATATSTLPPSMNNQTATLPIKACPASNPEVEEWEVAIFRLYDSLMPAAISAGSSVTSMHLPWPVLEFESKYYSTTTIKDKDIKQGVVSDFILTYGAWKGWSFKTAREKMKSDWESVHKVFPKERPGKKRVENVVKCITAAV